MSIYARYFLIDSIECRSVIKNENIPCPFNDDNEYFDSNPQHVIQPINKRHLNEPHPKTVVIWYG